MKFCGHYEIFSPNVKLRDYVKHSLFDYLFVALVFVIICFFQFSSTLIPSLTEQPRQTHLFGNVLIYVSIIKY